MTESSSKLKVREAHSRDARLIAQYNTEMALETETRILDADTINRGVERGISQPERCRYFVAELDGQVVGQAMITFEWSDWRNGELWWLQSVYVHPDYRRLGVFRSLFAHIEAIALTYPDVRGIRLYVESDNTQGQEVYKKLGMVPSGYHVFELEF